MKNVLSLLLLVSGLCASLEAQTLPDLEYADSVEEMIRLAEAEGSRYPTASAQGSERLERYGAQLGGSARACTETADQSAPFAPVRSGEFVVGTTFSRLATGRPAKMWWSPAENSGDMDLLVRGRKLGDEAEVLRWESDEVAFPVGPNPPRKLEEIDDWFFPSDFKLPSAGDWIIVATSGTNWGCFVVRQAAPDADASS